MSFIGEMPIPKSNQDLEKVLRKETLNQVALLQSLSQGDFLGSVTVGELKTMGDTGIGTFDKLDGELIMLQGVVYKARGDGKVYMAEDNDAIPFADVTFMDSDVSFEVEAPCDFKGLAAQLDRKIERVGTNMFYMATVECALEKVRVRAPIVHSEEGNPTLAEYMADAEMVYDHENVSGHLVGLYCPPFMAGLNMPGWHLHFISSDKPVGGHVLDFKLARGKAEMDQTRCFNMILPDSDNKFMDMDLTLDQSDDLAKIEARK